MNRLYMLDTLTLEEIEKAAEKYQMKVVEKRRYEEYSVRERILELVKERYGGVAYSGDSFRLYQDGVWESVHDLYVQNLIYTVYCPPSLQLGTVQTFGATRSILSLYRQ